MKPRWIPALACLLIIAVYAAGCASSPAPSAGVAPLSSETAAVVAKTAAPQGGLHLQIGSIPDGGTLPDAYTCKGSSESPPVSWDGIPAGTKSLVLILDDPDAPAGTFTHWIVYNIPPEKGSFAPARPNAKVLENGAQQGDTSAGSRGYYPPCPPIGTTHRYVFRLYAVDMDITQPTADRDSIEWALNGHKVANTTVTTTFRR